ncbi:MAG: hypothetical protein R2827_14620 [Bdellovibrionales bacterium]
MISEGLRQFNELQVFTYDVGEILSDHEDFVEHHAKLTRTLAKADPSPFIQAVTAFQFARLFAKDAELHSRLNDLQEQLLSISRFYRTRLGDMGRRAEELK